MRQIKVYRERRSDTASSEIIERRTYCWMIEQCDAAVRAACHAHIVHENCWDFWAGRAAKYKGCCHKLDDCRDCSIPRQRFTNELPVYVRPPEPSPTPSPAPSTKRAVCEHLHLPQGLAVGGQAFQHFLRDPAQTDRRVLRCRRRGVYLDPGYVSDICVSRGGRECVFL